MPSNWKETRAGALPADTLLADAEKASRRAQGNALHLFHQVLLPHRPLHHFGHGSDGNVTDGSGNGLILRQGSPCDLGAVRAVGHLDKNGVIVFAEVMGCTVQIFALLCHPLQKEVHAPG